MQKRRVNKRADSCWMATAFSDEVKANRSAMSVNENRFWSSECVKMRDGDRRDGLKRRVQ